MTITYKKISNQDDWQVRKLIESVLEQLENKDFFIPISENELTELYNEKICILYGAYDADKLVAIAKLDLNNQYDVAELKQCLNIEKYQVAELGRYLCLPEYRRNGIMKNLQKILIDKAIKLNYDYLVVTAHPENLASNKTILKDEFELKNTKILSTYIKPEYAGIIEDVKDTYGEIKNGNISNLVYENITQWFKENNVIVERTATGKNMYKNILTYIVVKGFVPESVDNERIYLIKEYDRIISKKELKNIYKDYVENMY